MPYRGQDLIPPGVLALVASGSVRAGWTFLGALVAGTTMWSTHFVAMLAFQAPAKVHHDPLLTMLSLLIGVVGSYAAFTVGMRVRRGTMPVLGGGLFALVAAGMHYVGMAGYQIDAPIHWDHGLAFGSIAAAVVLTAAAMAALRGQLGPRLGLGTATGLLVTGLLELHFVGMFALKVMSTHAASGVTIDSSALALAIAMATGLIVAAGAFAYMIDGRRQAEARDRLAAAAANDELTGLGNNNAFVAEMARRVAATGPTDNLGMLAMHVANISAIHQRHGTVVVERVIQAIGHRLVGARKPGVFLARIAGAQFCGLGAVDDRADLRERSRRIHEALSRDLLIDGIDIVLDIRVGSAMFPADADGADGLIRKAHAALKLAMSDPLNPVVLHDGRVDATSQRQLALQNDLHGALDRGEFELYYQPQVLLSEHRVIGYEALLRWHHPRLGAIPPCEFIPLAERSGSILPIGEWVLRTACATAATWDNDLRIAVNVSSLQLRQPNLPAVIHEALLATGLLAGRLEIELTESLLVEDRASALHALRRIKALGVRLALDDFGTGYSSMDVLRQFPFDKIKLDKSFVDDVERNPQARAILHAMLTLGRALAIPILVEGVETAHQLAILQKEGCTKVQGYLIGRPAPIGQLGHGAPEQLSA